MAVRRSKRRQFGGATPQATRPKFLDLVHKGVSGPADVFAVEMVPEGTGTDIHKYTGALILDEAAAIDAIRGPFVAVPLSIGWDNNGAGGQCQLYVELPNPLGPMTFIWIPAWMQAIRGAKGEWISPGNVPRIV